MAKVTLKKEQPSNPNHQQHEMSFGLIYGKSITKIPENLYIPPDALEVILEAFEGPLDLLLYLIRRQNIDILEINVAIITSQYMDYIEAMNALQFGLAAEYLLMASLLAEIKSRMLLPRQKEGEEMEEEDPKANLILRLLEYERFKEAAENIDDLPRMNRDIFPTQVDKPVLQRQIEPPKVEMQELLLAFTEVLKRSDLQKTHTITSEKLSTRERMSHILTMVKAEEFIPFISLFDHKEGRPGIIVTFLALMELIRNALVNVVQSEEYGIIHIKAPSH